MATTFRSTMNNDNGSPLFAAAIGYGLGIADAVGRKAAVEATTAAAGDWFEGRKAEVKQGLYDLGQIDKASPKWLVRRCELRSDIEGFKVA